MQVGDIVKIRPAIEGMECPEVAKHWAGSKCMIKKAYLGERFFLEFIDEVKNTTYKPGNIGAYTWYEEELELLDDSIDIKSDDVMILFD